MADASATERWRRGGGRPLVVAHRGASLSAPENTVAAILAARAAGADAVELDVRLSADGVPVLLHDADLGRVAGRPERVDRLTAAELARVRVGDEPLPTLDEAIEAAGDLLLDVEIKFHGLRDRGLEARVAARLEARGCARRALVSSFDPLALLRFRRAAPAIPRALIFHGGQSVPFRRAWAAPLIAPAALAPQAAMVERAAVEAWHRRGLAVAAWTVDDPAEARRLAGLGVDALVTNDPATILRALAG